LRFVRRFSYGVSPVSLIRTLPTITPPRPFQQDKALWSGAARFCRRPLPSRPPISADPHLFSSWDNDGWRQGSSSIVDGRFLQCSPPGAASWSVPLRRNMLNPMSASMPERMGRAPISNLTGTFSAMP
jgi:hypothetical protein